MQRFFYPGEPLHTLLHRIDDFVTLGTMELKEADEFKRVIKLVSADEYNQVVKVPLSYETMNGKILYGVLAYINLNSQPNNADPLGTLIYSYNAFSYGNRECLLPLY